MTRASLPSLRTRAHRLEKLVASDAAGQQDRDDLRAALLPTMRGPLHQAEANVGR